MVRRTRPAIFLSLAVSSHLSASKISTAQAFTSGNAPSVPIRDTLSLDRSVSYDESRLFYQAGAEEAYTAEDAAHIDDFTHQSILHNRDGQPVLVDCYTNKCGPCKLIERSFQSVLPKYSDNLLFCKWDADEKENSQQFMDMLREHNMTFRKLPTLIIFVDGLPIAMRQGMATEGQLTSFLEENLPKDLPSLFVPTLRRRNAGGV